MFLSLLAFNYKEFKLFLVLVALKAFFFNIIFKSTFIKAKQIKLQLYGFIFHRKALN